MGKAKSAASGVSRVVQVVERLLKAKTLVSVAKVSEKDIAAAERELGAKLPPDYVALVLAVGAIQDPDDDDDYDFAGWSGSLHRVLGPKDAVLLTKKIRLEAGPGRHEKIAADTLFFLRWERTLETFGVDSKGAVRGYRVHRAGTLLRVAYASLEQCLVDKIGEMEPAQSVDAAAAPTEVTHLELMESSDLPKVKKLPALEKLSVWNLRDGAPLTVVRSLKNLRELHLGGEVIDVPDDVFLAPSLERVEFANKEMQKRFSGGLGGVLKWFHTDAVPAKSRPLYVRLLIDDAAWLKKNARIADLLDALDAPNDRIVENALAALEPHLTAPKKIEKARIAILGRTVSKRSTLETQIAAAKATLDDELTKSTSFAVIGAHPKGAHEKARKLGVPLVLETQLRKALDGKGARYLAKQRGEAPETLREMLLSSDAGNVRLAVTMMQEGGVPDGVLEAIFLAIQSSKLDAKLKAALEKLANEKMPAFSKVVRDVFARTNITKSGATKLADRLVALEQKSKGALSGRVIALGMLRDYDADNSAASPLLYAFETGDAEFAFETLSRAASGGTLSLSFLEARVGPAIDRVPKAFARLGAITTLSAICNFMRELPRALAPLTSVRELELTNNDLKSLPDYLAGFRALEVLDVSDNRLATFPPVLLELPALRKLDLSQSERKPQLREIPEAIAALKKLEELDIGGQKFARLPHALGKLPALHTLTLDGATVDAWPENLADAPKLASLDVERVSTKDKSGLKAIVAKAKARGVTVRT